MENETKDTENKEQNAASEINEEELAKALDDFLNLVDESADEEPDEIAAAKIDSAESETVEEVTKSGADNRKEPGKDDKTRGGKDLLKNKTCKADEEEMDDEEEDKKDLMKKKKMKKSEPEYTETDEYQEFLAWKESKAEEAQKAEKENLVEDLKKAVLTDNDEKFAKVGNILKSLHETVSGLSGKASRGRKSYESVHVIEKAIADESEDLKKSGEEGEATDELLKSRMLEQAEGLCKAGLVEIEDVTILERTGKITPQLQKAVERAGKLKESRK